MGNRGTVVFTDGEAEFSPAIYLHWNGGPDSVYAFLAELNRRNVRADQCYEAARFCQIVGEFFDQGGQCGDSLGVVSGPAFVNLEDPTDPAALAKALSRVQTDLGDNGLYLVNRTTTPPTVRRFKFPGDVPLEMGVDDVATEAGTAAKSTYAKEFAEFFTALAKKPAAV